MKIRLVSKVLQHDTGVVIEREIHKGSANNTEWHLTVRTKSDNFYKSKGALYVIVQIPNRPVHKSPVPVQTALDSHTL